MTKALHLNRPSDAAAATKLARAQKRGDNYAKTLLPALVKERQREFAARVTRAQLPASQVPMCNATMPGTYRTGDGDVQPQPRPGSLRAFTLPSHGDRT